MVRALVLGTALASVLALSAPAPALANEQDDAAALMMFGLMAGGMAAGAMNHGQHYHHYQEYPGYCWLEQRYVMTPYGYMPRTVRVCQ